MDDTLSLEEFTAMLLDRAPVDVRGPPPTAEELAKYPEYPAAIEFAAAQGPKKGGARRPKEGGDIVNALLLLRNQIKLYHWQTNMFSRHKATDELVTTLDINIDKFVEVFMGKYGRPQVTHTIALHNFTDTEGKAFIDKQIHYFQVEIRKTLADNDTDLLTICDEILGDLNQVRYLFTLA